MSSTLSRLQGSHVERAMNRGSPECDSPTLFTVCRSTWTFYETVSHTASLPSAGASDGRLLNRLTRSYRRDKPNIIIEPRMPPRNRSQTRSIRVASKRMSGLRLLSCMVSSAHLAYAAPPVIIDDVAQLRALRINPKLLSARALVLALPGVSLAKTWGRVVPRQNSGQST